MGSTARHVVIAVALSGGVDSAVTGLFLRRCVRTVADIVALRRTPYQLAHEGTGDVLQAIIAGTPWSSIVPPAASGSSALPRGAADARSTPVAFLPLFMRNWEDPDDVQGYWCEQSKRDYIDAMAVARSIGLLGPMEHLKELNFSAEYISRCFDPMLDAYRRGDTLNADVLCNSDIKFGALLRYAMVELGVTGIATGHYARTLPYPEEVVPGPATTSAERDLGQDSRAGVQQVLLARPYTSSHDHNDQTVFLSRLQPGQLERAVFPLGHLFSRKREVRRVAAALGLAAVAAKKSSTGLCFVGSRPSRSSGTAEEPRGTPGSRHTVPPPPCAKSCHCGFPSFVHEYISSRDDDLRLEGLKECGVFTRFVEVNDVSYGAEAVGATDGPPREVNVNLKHPFDGRRALPAYALTVGQKVQGHAVAADGDATRPSSITSYYVCQKVLATAVSPPGLSASDSQCDGTVYLAKVVLSRDWNHPSLLSRTVNFEEVVFTADPKVWLRHAVRKPLAASEGESDAHDTDAARTSCEYSLSCYACCRHQEPLRRATVMLRWHHDTSSSTVPHWSSHHPAPQVRPRAGEWSGCTGQAFFEEPVRAVAPGQAIVLYVPCAALSGSSRGWPWSVEPNSHDLVVVASGWIRRFGG